MTIVSIASRACIFRHGTDYPGAHFNRGANAVWLGVEWVNESHNAEEVAALAEKLNQYQMRYVFVYTSYLKPDGQFNPTYAHAGEFVQMLKTEQPELNVQAWVGLPLENVDLGNVAIREEIAEFCASLVCEGGFDGVHLDPEPVATDDPDILALLDDVRRALGPEVDLSVASRRIWPVCSDVRWPVIGQVAWRASYYRQIAERVDQIAVMTYDSAMPSALLYRQWTRFQVIEVSRAVDGTGTQVLIGVPTSEEATGTHRPDAETMKSGLEGVIDGLNDEEARPVTVAGVAIYPYWETDESEWRIYEELWLGHSCEGR